MTITVELPEDVNGYADSARQALEAFALAGFRSGALSKRSICELLGFETRYELDGFLKEHQVFEGVYGIKEFEEDIATHERLREAGLLK